MTKHPFDYGTNEITRATFDKLVSRAGLEDVDAEILTLRFVEGMLFEDIAKLIGEKYFGRTADNPLWERSIRYRLNKAIKKLQVLGGAADVT